MTEPIFEAEKQHEQQLLIYELGLRKHRKQDIGGIYNHDCSRKVAFGADRLHLAPMRLLRRRDRHHSTILGGYIDFQA